MGCTFLVPPIKQTNVQQIKSIYKKDRFITFVIASDEGVKTLIQL
jgi:hypothetical protein